VTEPHDPGAPGDLDRIRQFLNTRFIEEGEEWIGDPAALSAWLRDRKLLDAGTALDEADVAQAQAFREALRAYAGVNHGEPMTAQARAELGRIGARAGLAFAYDGESHELSIETRARGIDAAFARLLQIIYNAQREGTWPRFQTCARSTCRWAFYDRSKNRSARWCHMAICGNREKAKRRRTRSRRAA
jgi:predicted RNA-binding Zn ribbon-like protein